MTLEPITHPVLDGVTHGFFTRAGGASSGIFEGLNCGLGSSDQAEIVSINRDRVRTHMAASHLQTVHQHHSADVAVISAPSDPVPIADALVTKTPGIALGVLSADCQPVLFWDADNSIIGAAHAGWKGAQGGVLQATVDAMVDIGANRSSVVAVIGPCISQSAYEVGPEFFETFTATESENAWYFANGKGDRYLFDLPSYGLSQLQSAKIKAAHWTGHCTYHDPARFFSYRRCVHNNDPDYGRLIASIRL